MVCGWDLNVSVDDGDQSWNMLLFTLWPSSFYHHFHVCILLQIQYSVPFLCIQGNHCELCQAGTLKVTFLTLWMSNSWWIMSVCSVCNDGNVSKRWETVAIFSHHFFCAKSLVFEGHLETNTGYEGQQKKQQQPFFPPWRWLNGVCWRCVFHERQKDWNGSSRYG